MNHDTHTTAAAIVDTVASAPNAWIDSLPCGWVHTLIDGTIVRANAWFAASCGQPLPLIAGQNLSTMLAPDSRVLLEKHYREARFAGGPVHELALDLTRPNGVRQPILASACAVGAKAGAADGVVLTMMPALETRRREQVQRAAWHASEQALRDLDGVPSILMVQNELLREMLLSGDDQALVATDAQGRVTAMNPAAERLTGLSAVEVEGLPIEFACRSFLPSAHTLRDCPVRLALRRQQVVQTGASARLRRSDGMWRWIVDSALPLADVHGNLTGALWIASEQQPPATGARAAVRPEADALTV